MKVAAIQTCPIFGSKPVNIVRLQELITEAANLGARVVVCPELATTGYSFMSETEAREEAEVIHPDIGITAVLRGLSSQRGIWIAMGLVELDPGTNQLYNSQILVCPDGTWVSYRKINRFGNDFLWAKPGRSNPPIIEIEGKKVGLLICRDVRDKLDDETWTSFYEPGDADVVLMSSNWGRGGFPANAWMDFVEDNRTALVVANRYGQETPNDFGSGGSCIIKADGQVLTNGLIWNQDCIVLGDI